MTTATSDKPRFRTTFPKELRQEAKESQGAMAAGATILPDGQKIQHQGVLDVVGSHRFRWAMKLFFDPSIDSRDLPDFERIYNSLKS